MPLIKSSSPKAFSENVRREMHAGKPQPQSLAIAYQVKRKAAGKKKKMAEGGQASADQRTSEELDMLHGQDDGHEQELRAASMRPSADDMDKERELRQLDAHPHMHSAELDARDEHMGGIDAERRRYALGGELDARDEHMGGIDSEGSDRDELMLDAHPSRHAEELDAKKGFHYSADDSDSMEMDMLHTENQPDEYSKAGLINYAIGGIVDAIRRKKRMAEGGDVDLQDSNGDEHLNHEDQLSYGAARKKTYYDNSQLKPQPKDSNEKGDVLQDEDAHGNNMIDAIRRRMKMKSIGGVRG